MSHRGGWHRSSNRHHHHPNNRGRPGRPYGLRGKDIGLYYRDLQMKKNKDNEALINLTIPPRILASLERTLENIRRMAQSRNMNLPPPKSMNVIPLKSETNLTETPSMSSDAMQIDDASTEKVKIEQVGENAAAGPSDEPQASHSSHSLHSAERQSAALRGAGDYKYGYEDIITGTFQEKLEECLTKEIFITTKNPALNDALYQNYQCMINSNNYKKMKVFREMLPAYKKSKELLEIINNNQVIVISGETGCGKSTQIPQIILDDALGNRRGANVNILVTQPRRIAASSLAIRVAQERSESLGVSVGYAVRLEKVESRLRGSIKFCTTGILLGELETNQGLTNYSHVILDEVHERDLHIDLSMMMVKQVLKKRKDLKLILMSATLDEEKLTDYFDNCPLMHIEGLTFPVQDVYLEDILEMTNFTLPSENTNNKNAKIWQRQKWKKKAAEMEKDIQYKAEIAPWLESIKKEISRDVYLTLQDSRIEELNIDLIFQLLVHISKGGPGAVLIFLPGINDITKLLKQIANSSFFPKSHYEIYPLHSKLPSLEQHKIFQRPPDHIRKIIIATNIAETSITIDDIVYVIDCGKIKYSGLSVEDNIPTLQTEWVSVANLRQRRGRAGRCQPGLCYHLLTTYRAIKLAERLLPEIQRNSLIEPVLAVKRLRLGKAAEPLSKMPSPPSEITVELAIKHLRQVGALDDEEKLTPLGWHLARLPVHPAAGKLLLLGTMFGCLDRAASVAAVWGFKDPFQLIIGKEKEVDEAKKFLALGEPSDHIAMSEAVSQFERYPTYGERRRFANDYYLSYNTLDLLREMKKQFGNNLKQMSFLRSGDVKSPEVNQNSDNMGLFKAIVAASLYPNVATVRWGRNPNRGGPKAKTPEDGNVSIHPSSVMVTNQHRDRVGSSRHSVSGTNCNWLVYWLKQQSSELYLIDVTLVNTLPFLFFGEITVSEAPEPSDYYITIQNVKVRCRRTTLDLLWQLRSLLDFVLASRISDINNPGNRVDQFESTVLDAVKDLLTAEDAEFLSNDDNDMFD